MEVYEAIGGGYRGGMLPELSSICRLTWKFGRSAILRYYVVYGCTVRNAIDDLTFLSQVIAGFFIIAVRCGGHGRGVCGC